MKKVNLKFIALCIICISAIQQLNAQCISPSGMSATVIDGTSSLLAWNDVVGSDSYTINVQSGNDNPEVFNITSTVTTTSYTVAGLTPGKNYKFKLRTNCGGDHSGWTAYFAFTSGSEGGAGTCDIPSGLAVTDITSTGANLNWNLVDAAVSYKINIQDGSGNPVDLNLNVTSTTNSYNVSGLNANSNYKFKVRTVCSSGKTSWSPYTTFTTGALKVNEPFFSLVVYPNPSKENVVCTLNNANGATIVLQDLSGKILFKQAISGIGIQQILIPVGNYSDGIYLISISDEIKTITEKLLIVK